MHFSSAPSTKTYTWTLTDADRTTHTVEVEISGVWNSWMLELRSPLLELLVRYLYLPPDESTGITLRARRIRHCFAIYEKLSTSSYVFSSKENAKIWLKECMVGEDGSFDSFLQFLDDVLQDQDYPEPLEARTDR